MRRHELAVFQRKKMLRQLELTPHTELLTPLKKKQLMWGAEVIVNGLALTPIGLEFKIDFFVADSIIGYLEISDE